jgi:hypothetical protein
MEVPGSHVKALWSSFLQRFIRFFQSFDIEQRLVGSARSIKEKEQRLVGSARSIKEKEQRLVGSEPG